MASAQHPTIEAGREGDDDTDRTRQHDDHPEVGIAHPTVVPSNYDDRD